MKSGKKTAKKVISIAFDVLFVCFFILVAFTLFMAISAKKEDGAMRFFGYEMRIVVSPSMESATRPTSADTK